jgi:hypothetical protein
MVTNVNYELLDLNKLDIVQKNVFSNEQFISDDDLDNEPVKISRSHAYYFVKNYNSIENCSDIYYQNYNFNDHLKIDDGKLIDEFNKSGKTLSCRIKYFRCFKNLII